MLFDKPPIHRQNVPERRTSIATTPIIKRYEHAEQLEKAVEARNKRLEKRRKARAVRALGRGGGGRTAQGDWRDDGDHKDQCSMNCSGGGGAGGESASRREIHRFRVEVDSNLREGGEFIEQNKANVKVQGTARAGSTSAGTFHIHKLDTDALPE